MPHADLVLKTVSSADAPEMTTLMALLEGAFATAMEEYPAEAGDMPTPSGEDIRSMLAEGKEVLAIERASKAVGGAVLSIDPASGHNTVELLFISAAEEGHGLGTQAWRAIEARYPDTKRWALGTPYFLKRNIHFYINKCGFTITKYYNKWNPFVAGDKCETGDFFWFEKNMS